VFLTGMEEGICPHSRAISEEKGIEEERRLVYVGMTRARQSLTLTRAVYRRIFGN
jgi:DNA helicase-2/ATP-dependent DNA helicase PcrA